MSTTSIEWTDRTWNPLRGCSRVSEGCRNCYAERIAARFSNPGNTFHGFAERTPDGPRWTGDVVLLKDRLPEPFSWKTPQRVFVNSMSDLFHENLPAAAIDRVFAVMALTPQHTYQILTKRPGRMRSYLVASDNRVAVQNVIDNMESEDDCPFGDDHAPLIKEWPLPNVWLGVSVENQATADERIPLLLQTPAAVRFISAEPLLEAVNLSHWLTGPGECIYIDGKPTRGLDWVIVGGES